MNNERTLRIQSELKDLYKNSLEDNKIYIDIDDDNISILKILLIGSKDTPYENGFFLFTLRFPDEYPWKPPIVWFYTTNNKTRMNPNLYVNGKVCLSIINTWGSSCNWTPSMTVRSILISIQSMVLNEKPLYNEPGIKFSDKSIKDYNTILNYFVFLVAINGVLKNSINRYIENNSKLGLVHFDGFKEIINKYFIDNIDWYLDRCNSLKYEFEEKILFCPTPLERYKFVCNYKYILKSLIEFYELQTKISLKDKYFNINEELLKELKSLKVAELKLKCKEHKIKGYSNKRKKDIINLILDNLKK